MGTFGKSFKTWASDVTLSLPEGSWIPSAQQGAFDDRARQSRTHRCFGPRYAAVELFIVGRKSGHTRRGPLVIESSKLTVGLA